MTLTYSTLNEVEQFFREGRVTEDEVAVFLRAWNAGPHFTQAVLTDGRIRNFDPALSGACYRHLKDRFGLRL